MWVFNIGPFFFQINFDFFPQLLSFFINIKLASDTIPLVGYKNNVFWIKARHLVLYLRFNYWIQYHWKLQKTSNNKQYLFNWTKTYNISWLIGLLKLILFSVIFVVKELLHRATQATKNRQHCHVLTFNTISYIKHYL